MEYWKYVPKTNERYMISSKGRLKSLNWNRTNTSRIMKLSKDSKGYLRTSIIINDRPKTIKVHRLVAETFIPNSENKPQVNHKDFNTMNNNVDNLGWCTARENYVHSARVGRMQIPSPYNKIIKRGELNGCSKLKSQEVLEIRSKFKPREYTRKMLAKEYDVKESTIKDIILKRSWKHLEDVE